VYGTLDATWRIVARTVFHQLNYSVIARLGTVIGMFFFYLSPPVMVVWAAVVGEWPAAVAASAAWFTMGWAFAPTLYRYGLSLWYGFTLPVAGFLYTLMTLDFARRHWL